MKTVIEMAREVKATAYTNRHYPDRTTYTFDPDRLEAFAALIRADERSSWPAEMEAMERQVNILTDALADERERMKWDVHSCGPTCKRYACVALAQAKVDEREATNNAYRERNQLVALLSTLFSSGKAKTAIEGWDEAWHGCVYIDFPWGQASWHYHTDDEWMFEHLPPYTEEWDGHTTEAKYAMIALAVRARSNS